MVQDSTNVAIVGGGLSGGLIALALTRALPQLPVRLVEAGERLGGNHRWSWFASDLDTPSADLMTQFPRAEWGAGYEVRFPKHGRRLQSAYRSLSSDDFDTTLQKRLNQGGIVTGQEVVQIAQGGVELANGDRIAAETVIDCRGIRDAPELNGGWQVFLGQTLRCDQPHGQIHPVIMDATVEQLDGYRFVYVLPLNEYEIFVEDTYYQDSPILDPIALRSRIAAYVERHGWRAAVVDEETGLLPVITGGDFTAFQAAQRIPGVAVAGARGGFVHPLTSYTLPFAARVASRIASAVGTGRQGELATMLEVEASRHWKQTAFYRLLGQMLFGAADPAERYRIFERFYMLRQPLIERFYAGRSSVIDKARILAGKPPVPISGAIGALGSQRPPLTAPNPSPRPSASQKAAYR